jgi:plasmid stabilization system protein ParE
VRAAADLISSGPERWPTKNGLRRYVLRRFPFTIAYRFASDFVEILAVAHHGRDPRRMDGSLTKQNRRSAFANRRLR